MDLRERVARLLFVDATAGTGFCWDGELRQEGAHREAAYSLADAILAMFAEERAALEENLRSHAYKRDIALERAKQAEAREAKLVEALEEVAGMDCAKSDKYIGIGPCGVCISCKARAALASVKDG